MEEVEDFSERSIQPSTELFSQIYTATINFLFPSTPTPLPQVQQQVQQLPQVEVQPLPQVQQEVKQPSSDFQFVCSAQHLKDGNVKVVTLENGASVAVFYNEGHLNAIDNYCAHKQAELSIGDIEDLSWYKGENESTSLCVRCPKHKLEFCGGLYFNLSSGRALTKLYSPKLDPSWKLATYQVLNSDDNIFVSKVPINGVDGVAQAKKRIFWAPVTLMEIKKLNHDTYVYEFVMKIDIGKKGKLPKDVKMMKKVLQKKKYTLWHLDLKSNSTDNPVVREYTPISSWKTFETSSRLSLLIKLYSDGKMSQALEKAQVGDIFTIGPPKQTAEVAFFDSKIKIPPIHGKIGFIAGGTGITPVYQLITHIVQNLRQGLPSPAISVLYSNKTVGDILMLEELSKFQAEYPEHVVVYHAITRECPPKDDKFFFGRVSLEIIKKVIPAPEHSSVFVSGPKGMWEVVLPFLLEVGHKKESCTELEA